MCLGCKSKKSTSVTKQCNHLFNELVMLKDKAMLKRKESKDLRYSALIQTINVWISNLNFTCPDENEINTIIEILDT